MLLMRRSASGGCDKTASPQVQGCVNHGAMLPLAAPPAAEPGLRNTHPSAVLLHRNARDQRRDFGSTAPDLTRAVVRARTALNSLGSMPRVASCARSPGCDRAHPGHRSRRVGHQVADVEPGGLAAFDGAHQFRHQQIGEQGCVKCCPVRARSGRHRSLRGPVAGPAVVQDCSPGEQWGWGVADVAFAFDPLAVFKFGPELHIHVGGGHHLDLARPAHDLMR